MLPADILIARETILGGRVIHDHALLRPDDVVEDGGREVRRCRLPSEQTDRDRVASRGGFSLDLLLFDAAL